MFRVKRYLLSALRRFLPDRAPKQPDFQQSHSQRAESEIRVAALVQNERDRELLSRLALEHQWVLHFAQDGTEVWEVLNARKAQIFLFEREAAGPDWRALMRKVVSGPHLVCAILVSDVTDGYLWNEVVMWGGHDVLVRPLGEENVARTIRLAWLYWNSAVKSKAGSPKALVS